MSEHVDRFLRESRPDTRRVVSFVCTVATTATEETDDVYVTIDDEPTPRQRYLVNWRPSITASGTIDRRFPERNDKGVLIPTDTGLPWLIW